MCKKLSNKYLKIGIIGLGYVGLPLAVEFGKRYSTVGFDINQSRVDELNKGTDSTLEVKDDLLQSVLIHEKGDGLYITTDKSAIEDCNIYIVTVPTPIDKNNRPVLMPLYKASKTVGYVLKKNDIVIYESTVYPGATEEECVPVLEKISGLKYNVDFFCGYSPERINPGDKEHSVTNILKVTSGSNAEVAEVIDRLYRSIIKAGTFKASCIKVAEAAKVIENSQRDINIAFVNELAKIFNLLEIDTLEVLEAAGTKWNFLPFRPGLVGGHCIGVDPYYLAKKAQEIGYHPEIILAGRRLNDSMGDFVVSEIIKLMIKNDIPIKNNNALLLGITFKENCPDIRNTRVIDVYHKLQSYGMHVDVFDPWANREEAKREYNIDIFTKEDNLTMKGYGAIVLAVSHKVFLSFDLDKFKADSSIVYDIKSFFQKDIVSNRL